MKTKTCNVGPLKGLICATITPFTESLELDIESLHRLYVYYLNTEIQGIFPLGTNGEGSLLSIDERKTVAEIATKTFSGKKTVVIHCGASTLNQTVELIKHAKDIGSDGVGVIVPSFYKFDQRAISDYYSSVIDAADPMPVYLYNIPSRTGIDINKKTIKDLADSHSNLVGMKFSDSNLEKLADYINEDYEHQLDFLIGCDRLMYPAYRIGAVGTISGPIAVFPELFSQLFKAIEQNDEYRALELQKKLYCNNISLKKYQEIPMIKEYLKSIGVISSSTCRAPFYTMTNNEVSVLINDIKRMKA